MPAPKFQTYLVDSVLALVQTNVGGTLSAEMYLI